MSVRTLVPVCGYEGAYYAPLAAKEVCNILECLFLSSKRPSHMDDHVVEIKGFRPVMSSGVGVNFSYEPAKKAIRFSVPEAKNKRPRPTSPPSRRTRPAPRVEPIAQPNKRSLLRIQSRASEYRQGRFSDSDWTQLDSATQERIRILAEHSGTDEDLQQRIIMLEPVLMLQLLANVSDVDDMAQILRVAVRHASSSEDMIPTDRHLAAVLRAYYDSGKPHFRNLLEELADDVADNAISPADAVDRLRPSFEPVATSRPVDRPGFLGALPEGFTIAAVKDALKNAYEDGAIRQALEQSLKDETVHSLVRCNTKLCP